MVLLGCFLSSCAATQPYGHEKYRGKENTPHTQFETHQVNPNMAMNLSPQEFDELLHRWNEMERLKRKMIENNARAAMAEKKWISRQRPDRNSIVYKTTDAVGDGIKRVIRDLSKGLGDALEDSFN